MTATPMDDDGLAMPRRRWAMLAIWLAMVMAVLDGAIANVALPTLAHDLHTSASSSIWVINAYQVAVTVCLLPLASLGEILGYQRVYRVGIVVFTLASLACALSHSLLFLTLARVVQGIGAGGVMSINPALVRFVYPRRMLGRVIGLNAMIIAASSAVGPSVAAAILSVADWPWLFAVNVPIGLVSFLLAIRNLPETPRATHRFDIGSALLSAMTFGLLVAVVDGIGHKLDLRLVLGLAVLMLVCGTLLVRRQFGRAAPLLPLDLLRIPMIALSIGTSIASFVAQLLAFASLPFYLENTLGRTAVQTGLLLTPWPLAITLIAPVSGRLADRYSAGLLGGCGLLVLGLGLLLLVGLPSAPSDFDLVWRLAVCGLGFGLFQSPNNRAALSAAPRLRSGGAGGLMATARLLGQTIGATLVGMIFALAPRHGTVTALAVASGCAILAALISMMRLRLAPAESKRPGQNRL